MRPQNVLSVLVAVLLSAGCGCEGGVAGPDAGAGAGLDAPLGGSDFGTFDQDAEPGPDACCDLVDAGSEDVPDGGGQDGGGGLDAAVFETEEEFLDMESNHGYAPGTPEGVPIDTVLEIDRFENANDERLWNMAIELLETELH